GAAIGEAVDHADRRLGARGDLEDAPGIAHALLLLAAKALVVFHLLLDIATRRERLVAGAGDDQAADRVVALEGLHRVEQLGSEPAVHGVEGIRPVEGDDADPLLALYQDMLVCHRHVLLHPPTKGRLAPGVRRAAPCRQSAGVIRRGKALTRAAPPR